MKLFAVTLTVIILNCDFTFTKQFEQCEFAVELFKTHEVSRDDIYKHLCIVSALHTGQNVGGHLGIYNIGSLWWCKKDEPGGSCNVTCSDLLDDDIADDVACANLILSQQGVEAFGTTMRFCKKAYGEKANECMADADVFEYMVDIYEGNLSVPLTTISTSTSPRTIQTTTTIRTTSKASLSTPRFYSTSTSAPSTSSTQSPQSEESVQKESSSAFGWIIVVASIALMITLFAVKFKSTKSPNVSYHRNHGFDNTLAEV